MTNDEVGPVSTRRFRRASARMIAVVASASLLFAGLVATPLSSAEPASAASAGRGTLTQKVVVGWYGTDLGKDKASFTIPGIGTGQITCNPKATMIRITATDRSAETQMWTTKSEQKDGQESFSVKNARIYRYANSNDNGKGGTGKTAQEGFNIQNGRIENSSSGYLYGVISQRAGRNKAASGSTPPNTSVELTWSWDNFHKSAKKRTCVVKATFTTTNMVVNGSSVKAAVKASSTTRTVLGGKAYAVGTKATVRRSVSRAGTLGVNWHGNTEGARRSGKTITVSGIGKVSVICRTGKDGDAVLRLRPVSSTTTVWVEQSEGEGPDAITTESYYGSAARFPDIDLPSNGMLHGYISISGNRRAEFTLSSYRKTNDKVAARNLCEVALIVLPS